ncbi:Trihelix transcription factor ENAP2 [Linum grandiflorum]
MDPSTSRGLSRGGGGGGGREDCWSEGATECLVEAWGDRYVSVKNGTLRQKDWKEVADAVNARRSAAGQPPRTDIQCKNRIDTLKKKYKVEKTKPPPSKWQFFRRLDSLIGSSTAATSKKKPAGSTVAISVKSKPRSVLHKVEPSSISTSGGGGGSSSSDVGDAGFDERVVKKQQRMEDVSGSDGAACKELARAILKFAEIYEKTESSKQKQMVELEKQRMEFTKELEFERMNMFMAAQLDMKKKTFKRQKVTSGSGGE